MWDRNRWNQFIYALWAPVYDWFVDRSFFATAREHALGMLNLQAGEEVLLVGVGTGPDFKFLPEGIRATGIDLSEAMLEKAREKLPLKGKEVVVQRANAENLPFPDESFDAAILILILSVVGDGKTAMRETLRVLRPGGRAVVFDKFIEQGRKPSFARRLLNTFLTKPFGTDINRSLEPMLEALSGQIVDDQPSLLNGAYRRILIFKKP